MISKPANAHKCIKVYYTLHVPPTCFNQSCSHLQGGLLQRIRYDMIYLTATGQPHGGSSSVHIYTQTIQRTTQKNQYIEQHKKYIEQHKNQEDCGPCPVFAGFTLTFALQLRKKHGKISVMVVIHKHTMRIHSHNNKIHK